MLLCIPFLEIQGQNPELIITKEKVLEHKIKSVNIVLDSAGIRYQLPFDTLRTIEYSNEGEKLKYIGFRSEFIYIWTKSIFELEENKTTILIQDSTSFGDVSYKKNELFFTDGKLSVRKSYEKRNDNWLLNDSILFVYNSLGNLVREEKYLSSPMILSIKGEYFQTDRNEINYYYDEESRLDEKIEFDIGSDNSEKVKVKGEKIYYEDGKKILISTREDYRTKKDVERKTEVLYNTLNQKVKEIEYNSDGTIWFVTDFIYNSLGLLIEEIGYKEGVEFSYKFISLYETFE